MIAQGCNYCESTLPTIRLRTTQLSNTRICRACILEALHAIEDPEEYPCIIEDRDADLDALKRSRKE